MHMAAQNLCAALIIDVKPSAYSTLSSMQAQGWIVLGGSGRFPGSYLHSEHSRAFHTQARGSKAWHDSDRHGELPGQAPASTGGPGLQSPATPAPGAAGEAAPAKTSPVLETATALGFRRVIDASANLSAADITIELAPAVLAGLWRRLGGLDLSPLAETVYQESPGKKELVSQAHVLDLL